MSTRSKKTKTKKPKSKSKSQSKSVLGSVVKSLPGQFIIGGLTVAGIAYASNNASSPIMAGIIGALPIGMPSSVFVDDNKVAAYAYHLFIFSIPLIIGTFLNWYLLEKEKFSKYESVGISLTVIIVMNSMLAFTLAK